ncbi:fructose-specific PTS transporter subunit EIIC [Staphylococcus intermedius]|uniref:PTS system fructose-specific IIC component n=1 Tax=Staphylococcus intermedius NCTC 11048 TaxID=1141106 RepID=A0A380G3Y5_STAIN|nr:fructose-specific PTS transporter subunit EIIC [Staphylococcus intermedius]PCF78667.1 PTS mannose transporter subunit IIABC [Staphylococcus intermedius]PCF79640.1 PTS mannose transporter subunit IIABC [Staphylococcus intermedius]PCF89701.1 PTS mannose transporter subunit IIABC [Staphylococcus intermedius]PNZ52483.1 PTS mannose transporter subunit IIABC [Staphylococcus intermedius NCTC 11048]SUM45745.1 PTS system fructose-specific IIC component [Staphylococcus intermedius NCTC 11048]
MKILAVTSCPNGIAHTYMAQEKLEQAAASLGIDIKVETQGGVGAENVLTAEEIAAADGIIIAADRQVDLSRFNGKPLVKESVRAGIHQPEALIERVVKGEAPVYHASGEADTSGTTAPQSENKQNGMQMVYQHLMNGVSFMVPFIVVGGLLIALALSLGGEKTATQGLVIPDDSFWKPFEKIGALAFSFMVPILAGYIAVSIADKPGLVPGMIGGAIAADGSFYGSTAGAGFLGGIVAGFLAGYIAKWIKNIKVPKAMAPIMPIIIIPIIASVLVGMIFIFVLGAPIAAVFETLTTWLKGMQGANIVILALIIGAMIAFDMGGPVNKVAFLFGSALIAEGNYSVMGMVAVAVCTPPIGLGLATFIQKRKFNRNEIEMGKASFTMGLFGITEGAIPFAAQDPLRIIPANMIGAMVASVIAALGHVGDRVAHGGPIVAVLGGIDGVLMFIVAVLAGSFVTTALVLTFKKQPTATATQGKSDEIETTVKVNEDADVQDMLNPQVMIQTAVPMDRDQAIDTMIERLVSENYVTDAVTLKEAVLAREAESTTALGMHIAMPHAKTNAVRQPIIAVLKHDQGVQWESLDGTLPQLVFLIVVPEQSHDTHLKVLQQLSKNLMHDDKRQQLLDTTNEADLFETLQHVMKA